jgi:hypothetical protein
LGGAFGGLGGILGKTGPATHLHVIVPEQVQAGQNFAVIVQALDAANHIAAGFMDPVQLTSSDPTATGSALITPTATGTPGLNLTPFPLNYTFTKYDQGVHVFIGNLTKPGKQTITATDASPLANPLANALPDTATTNVNPPPTLAKLVVTMPKTAAAGVPTPVTIAALGSNGQVLTHFTDTVSLSTSDTAATGLPSTYTFSGIAMHTFWVTFNTPNLSSAAGLTTVTATDGSISGSSSIAIYPAKQVTHFAIISAASVAFAGVPTPVAVVALNASNQVVPTYTGTITFSSSDMNASITPYPGTGDGPVFQLNGFTYTFTNSDSGKHVFYITFSTPGKQTLTITNSVITQTVNVLVVSTILTPTNFWMLASPEFHGPLLRS